MVTHHSTNLAHRCLTSEFRWDRVLSPGYDRRHYWKKNLCTLISKVRSLARMAKRKPEKKKTVPGCGVSLPSLFFQSIHHVRSGDFCLWPKGKRMISSNNMATCEKVQTFSVAGLGGATEGLISGLRRCVATSAFFSVPKRKNYLIQRSNGPLISLPETKINDSGGLLCLMLEVLRARKEPLHDQSRRNISHLF